MDDSKSTNKNWQDLADLLGLPSDKPAPPPPPKAAPAPVAPPQEEAPRTVTPEPAAPPAPTIEAEQTRYDPMPEDAGPGWESELESGEGEGEGEDDTAIVDDAEASDDTVSGEAELRQHSDEG